MLRLKVDVHIDEDGKCVSTLSEKNDVEISKSDIESSIELQCQDSEQLSFLYEGEEKNEESGRKDAVEKIRESPLERGRVERELPESEIHRR